MVPIKSCRTTVCGRRSRMNRVYRVIAYLCLAAVLARAASQREIAEWVLRWEGQVTLEGSRKPLKDVSQLPAGEIHLTGIDLTGAVMRPIELRKLEGLTDLRDLYLPGPVWNPGGGKEDVTGVFEALASLKNIERLAVGWHFNAQISIGDENVAHLLGWRELKDFRCTQCRITNLNLSPLTNLRSLDLSFNPFTDKGMEGLAGMTGLRRLILRDTMVTDEGLKYIAGLTNLEELDLFGARVTDKGIEYLRKLKSLRKLNLLGAQVTDDSMPVFASMEHLEALNLYRTKVTNSGLAQLQALKELTDIDLRYSRVTPNGIDALRAALPNAKVQFVGSAGIRPKAGANEPADDSEQAIAAWVKALGRNRRPSWAGISKRSIYPPHL